MIDAVIGVFDTETTGVDVESDRIVTAFIGTLDGDGNIVHSREWLINPGVEIPKDATNIHGITTERAQAEGVPPIPALREIDSLLAMLQRDGLPVVIYNAPYDLTILDRELRRHGGTGLSFTPKPIIDPYVIDKSLAPYRKGGRKLVDIAPHYGVEVKNAHDAKADAVMTGRIALAMLTLPKLVAFSLDVVHETSVLRKAEQMNSYAAWLVGQGKDASQIRTEWPIFPYPQTESERS